MNTLIELYGERAIENVIGPETFRPDRLIYMCPPEIAQDKNKLMILKSFYGHRGYNPEIEFVESSFYKTGKILAQMKKIEERYPDVVLDVTGGTDAALIAAGMFCQLSDAPTFTYSRKKNRFYDINHADFAEGLPCDLHYSVEDFFLMTGGILRVGRVDNDRLGRYTGKFGKFFDVFLKYRKNWADNILFLQKISKGPKGNAARLAVSGDYQQKGEKGNTVSANPDLLRDLEKIGYITDLVIEGQEKVSFRFADHRRRNWLRDVGSALELYMYRMCKKSGIFEDVISSAVVDWDSSMGNQSISNEIDVVATRGVVPLFISCKACDVKTVALNELAILAERFGGKGAKAAIVTTEHCNSLARHRAAQLDIAVIDIEEIENGTVCDRLKTIMKVEDRF